VFRIERRKNRTRTSYTLEWKGFGARRFLSLGPHATGSLPPDRTPAIVTSRWPIRDSPNARPV